MKYKILLYLYIKIKIWLLEILEILKNIIIKKNNKLKINLIILLYLWQI
jgi:hypothetical protein